MPKISILIPTYKPKKEYMIQVIECALRQTYSDFEIIICDEPTTVDTKEIVAPYLHDGRIQFYTNTEVKGISGNWNECLARATGQYIQFLFQDDVWEDTYLEIMMRSFLEHPNVDIVAANHSYCYMGESAHQNLYDGIVKLRKNFIGKEFDGKDLLKMWIARGLHPNIVGEPSFVMCTKKLIDTIGTFTNNLPQFLDSEYWVRCLLHCNIFFTSENVGKFRIHNEAASVQNQIHSKGLTDRLSVLVSLQSIAPTSIKKIATKSLYEHLPRMIVKYISRRKKYSTSAISKDSTFKKFVMTHPIVSIASFIKAMLFYKYYVQKNKEVESE